MELRAWIVVGALTALIIWEFCMICPDKIPFKRRRKK